MVTNTCFLILPLLSTHQCVHALRSMPVSILVVRMAVLISTRGSLPGLGPSREGDQGPPMAIGSLFPLSPTRNCINRVGCWKLSLWSDVSSAKAQDLWYRSRIVGQANSITCAQDGTLRYHHKVSQNKTSQQAQHTNSRLAQYWNSVANSGPTLSQHRINVPCLLGYQHINLNTNTITLLTNSHWLISICF